MQDEGIIRNRLKINAAVTNAKLFIDIQKEFGSFCDYIWGFVPEGKPIINNRASTKEVPARTEISDAISKDMKKEDLSSLEPQSVMHICKLQVW